MSGKRYEAQKNINRRRDERGVFKADAPSAGFQQMEEIPAWGKSTGLAYKQATEEGVGHSTITANANFAKGVDAIREISPGIAPIISAQKPK